MRCSSWRHRSLWFHTLVLVSMVVRASVGSAEDDDEEEEEEEEEAEDDDEEALLLSLAVRLEDEEDCLISEAAGEALPNLSTSLKPPPPPPALSPNAGERAVDADTSDAWEDRIAGSG